MLIFPTLNEEVDDVDDELTFFLDEENERAYWLDNGLMYAPYDGINIYGQQQATVTFDMIEQDVQYYMDIIDALKAVE